MNNPDNFLLLYPLLKIYKYLAFNLPLTMLIYKNKCVLTNYGIFHTNMSYSLTLEFHVSMT